MIRPVNMPFKGCRNSIFQANKILDQAKLLSYFCLGFFIVYISYPILWEDTCVRRPLFSGPRLAFLNIIIMLPFIYEPLVAKMTFYSFRRECARDEELLKRRVLQRVQKEFRIESPIKKDDWRVMVKKRGAKIPESEERKALEIASEVVIFWLARRSLPSPEKQSDKKYFSYEVFSYKREYKFDKLCGYVAPYVANPLFLGPDDGTVPCSCKPEDKAWKMAFSLGKDLLLRELDTNTYIYPQLRTNLEEIISFLYIRALEVTSESLYRHRQQVIEVTSELLNNKCKIKDEMCDILKPLPKRKTTWFKKVCVFKNKSCSMNSMTNLLNKMSTAVRSVLKKKQENDNVKNLE